MFYKAAIKQYDNAAVINVTELILNNNADEVSLIIFGSNCFDPSSLFLSYSCS